MKIIINRKEIDLPFPQNTITYEEVVKLGGGKPGVVYTMLVHGKIYDRELDLEGSYGRSLTPGETTGVREGFRFEFIVTGNA